MARGQPLDAREKAVVAERPADALGNAQAIEQVRRLMAQSAVKPIDLIRLP